VRRLPLLSVLFALVLALVTSACGDTVRPAAATVNGKTISQDALDDELEAIQGNRAYVEQVEQGGFQVLGQGSGTLTNDFVGRVLTRQIFLFLVHEELESKDLAVTDAELRRSKAAVVDSVGGEAVFNAFPKSYQETLQRRDAEVAKLQASLTGDEVTDEDVKAFYDENPEQFAETCVSHILFGVTDAATGQVDREATAAQADRLRGEAAAAKAEIDAGADFAALAAQRSVDSSNKDQGGDLECGPAGRFVPEFETAMDATAVGAVSDPVQTQFGFHLIKVTDRKTQSLEEATPAIQQQLEGEGQAEFSSFLQEALEAAKISVNPRYGRFSKDGQSPGIIPPGAPTTTVAGDDAPPAGGGTPNPLQP
jgi:foldase protein PrsA